MGGAGAGGADQSPTDARRSTSRRDPPPLFFIPSHHLRHVAILILLWPSSILRELLLCLEPHPSSSRSICNHQGEKLGPLTSSCYPAYYQQ